MKIIKTTLILSALLFFASGIAAAQPITITNVNDVDLNKVTGQEDPNMLPRAEPNDQRIPAGRMVDGELRIELLAVETEWYPRGPDGPRVVTPAFAEVGGPPQVPGPLVRASAGTPVHVTIRNTLNRPIAVRGLLDRASMPSVTAPPAGSLPAFAFSEPVVIPPGESRETRFTPTEEVSSFYYAQRLPPDAGGDAARPFNDLAEGAFMGALVIDSAGSSPPPDERVLMITRWGSMDDPDMRISWKMMLNGLSWPYTERLEYTVGDTVRWRVINASLAAHPMHLHGFYFTVDALGDTQEDTIYEGDEKPLAVTQMMEDFSSMRLTWVPEEPGNWLFHCHLVRHMAGEQRFASEREPGSPAHGHDDAHQMDHMAGMITGITIHPVEGTEEPEEEAPVRRIDLWTGERPDVYDGKPELAFLKQEGPEPPAPDSTVVPGSPLVLTRGEPTEIIVHNRLGIPLSVHWHGLELRSLYDGVGGWSGYPGATRPPIAPGDSVRVLITPPRSGSFMYHVHGEPGHELSQGLYGPFLVLEPGEERDTDADRVYMLASRGAAHDAAPAINGRIRPDPERFQPGRTYRLRFLHISADAFKEVRLLRDGKPVVWRTLAKDGAELPEAQRVSGPASLGIGVGETYDVEWTPSETGLNVLEVTTRFYPARGGAVTQRVPFAVGEVAEADLDLPQGEKLPLVPLSAAERSRYTGAFVSRFQGVDGDALELILAIWEEEGRLHTTGILPRSWDDSAEPDLLFPLGEHTFVPGRNLSGLLHPSDALYRFVAGASDALNRIEVEFGGQVVLEFTRTAELERSEAELRRFVGDYGRSGSSTAAIVRLEQGELSLINPGGDAERLVPITPTRFRIEGREGSRVDFEVEQGSVNGIVLVSAAGERSNLVRLVETAEGGAQ